MEWPRLGAVLHIRLDYLGVGRRAASRTWQKLCQREDTGLPWGKPYRGRIHIWDYPKGNQAIRTPSPVQGLTGDPGELTRVLGLASDCSAQSDCRGCLEDSTRVHHPVKKGAHIPGWGGMVQQAWHRPVLPAPLPVTQHTGRNWIDAEIVESCEGVRCRPARKLCRCLPKRRCAPTHGRRQHWYAKATASTIQWANLCLETAFPFCCHPWQTKSCSELLTLRVRSTYMRNALTGHSNAKAGSASSEGSVCRFTTWSRKGVVGTLGMYPGRGLKTTWE